ncbi:MAG: PfkB family carbohydrate kinase [Pseudomonadota bacterium]
MNLPKTDPDNLRSVLCIGGVHKDRVLRLRGAYHPKQSHPATTTESLGGVACNVARHLAHAGYKVRLAGPLGDDTAGDWIAYALANLGISTAGLSRIAGGRTASFTAICEQDGQMLVAAIDDGLYADWQPGAIDPAAVVFVDSNLSSAALGKVAAAAEGVAGWLVADGVSPEKVTRLRGILSQLDMLYLNAQELAALTGKPDVVGGIAAVQNQGVKLVIVGCGAQGLVLTGVWQGVRTDFTRPALPALTGLDGVTCGTGDAVIAALIDAHLTGSLSASQALEQARTAAQAIRVGALA